MRGALPRAGRHMIALARYPARLGLALSGEAVVNKQAVDLIAVGSGASGCGAALAAAAHGLNTLLLEKAPLLGGGTTYSYGGLWIGENHLEAAAGIEDSRDEARAYLGFLAGGAAIAANLNTYIDQAPVVLRRLEDWGLRFRIIPRVPDHYYPTAPGSKAEGRTLEAVTISRGGLGPWAGQLDSGPYLPPGVAWSDAVAWGGFGNRRNWDENVLKERAEQGLLAAGQALVGQLLGAALQRGVTVYADFAVRELLVSNGRVIGIRGSHRGEEVTVEATRGVVLATGSYESSPELIQQLKGFRAGSRSSRPASRATGCVWPPRLGRPSTARR
jgi:3-oxosteroid 1-dehydrogenase